MPGFGHWPALLLILIVVLIFWGPGKLPEIASAVGKAMHEFRKQSSDFQDEIRRSATPRSEPETYQSTQSADVATAAPPEVRPASPPAGPDASPSATPDVKS
jgi:TatA/E family protein of Tat protein translocase